MITAEDIFAEIKAEAMLLNGEVVRRAFRRIENICCGYLGHQNIFFNLIEQHKMAIDVAISAWRWSADPLTQEEKRSETPCWRLNQNRWAHATRCDQHRDDLRARLRGFWPCDECIKRDLTEREQLWLTKM